MSTAEKKAVTFLKGWRGYNTGETAGFDPEVAEKLVTSEVAKLAAQVDKAPAKGNPAPKAPASKGTPAGKAGASGKGNDSATGQATPGNTGADGGNNKGADEPGQHQGDAGAGGSTEAQSLQAAAGEGSPGDNSDRP